MYATPQDMIDRFGLTEMLRLSRPEDRGAETVDETKINSAIEDASATIEGYLRGRYQLPIQTPPKEIIRATCHLARHDLADTGQSNPSDHMITSRKEIMSWLKQISAGAVYIDAPAEKANSSKNPVSGARFSDRDPAFTNEKLKSW